MNRKYVQFLVFLALVMSACQGTDQEGEAETDSTIPAPVNMTFQVVNQYPHDTSAFTQGFAFYKGQLYESTGAPEEPSNSGTWIASLDLQSGKYDKKVNLGKSTFGEGIAFVDDKVFQLTWKSKKGYVYDAKTFRKIRDFNYQSEGWGLTSDGKYLIMSAGTSNIYYLTPDSLSFVKMLPVQDNNGYVDNINELEYINGFIYANKWLTNEILRIDPATGYVTAKYDLTKQANEARSKYAGAQEMNGIAYDSVTQKTYITGKKWPVIYEIRW